MPEVTRKDIFPKNHRSDTNPNVLGAESCHTRGLVLRNADMVVCDTWYQGRERAMEMLALVFQFKCNLI